MEVWMDFMFRWKYNNKISMEILMDILMDILNSINYVKPINEKGLLFLSKENNIYFVKNKEALINLMEYGNPDGKSI